MLTIGALLLKRGVADEGPPPPVATLRPPVRESGLSNMERTISLDDFLRSLATSDFSVSLFFSRKPTVS